MGKQTENVTTQRPHEGAVTCDILAVFRVTVFVIFTLFNIVSNRI